MTIPDLLARQAAAHPDNEAVAAADGPSLSYAALAALVARQASALARQGIARSSRVAVVLPNGLDAAIGTLAAATAAVAVPLAPAATVREYAGWFRAGSVSHLCTTRHAAPAARTAAESLRLPVIELASASDGQSPVCMDAAGPLAPPPPGPADPAVVLMTSGSTGSPKWVPLTHANLLAGAAAVAGSLALTAADRVLVMWEQYHVGGLVDLLLAPLYSGGSAVFAGGFDAARFFHLVPRVRPTWFQGVPATLRELLVHGRLSGGLPPGGGLRLVRSVAAPLPPEVMRDLEAEFRVPVIQTFGMTEASPLITTNRLPPGVRKPGSTGTPCGCEVAVLDDAGIPLPQGATGQIGVRGPNVFSGYENDAEANAAAFRAGWFMTGDVGRFDADGFLFLTGRIKELINRGGEKIAPAEIEAAATRHPAVAEAAAFAIPHPTLGEDVAVAIVPRGRVAPGLEAMRAHLARDLSRHKLPALLLVLDALPRCPIGKIRRQTLTTLAASQRDAARAPTHATSPGPSDPLAASLAALWALHLDLPSVGLDEDFAILGGDSLARIRLVAAVESSFGVSLPEDTAASITSVRRLAAEVRARGGRVPTDACGVADPPSPWGDDAGKTLADAAPADIFRQLAACPTTHAFDSLRESLLNVLTLDELAAVAEHASRESAAGLAGWCRDLREAAIFTGRPRWQRRRLAAGVNLYRRTAALSSRRLVVAFAGNHQRLMLPIHVVLDHLPPHDDLLLLADASRRHFSAGLPDIPGGIDGLFDWLAGVRSTGDHAAVVTFGTSAGGLAAVCAAHALGCSRAALVGADAPANHPLLERFLRDRIAATPPERQPTVILAYDPGNPRDRTGSEALAAMLPKPRILPLTAAGGHNTLRPALAAGRLAAVLIDLLGTDAESRHDAPVFT